MSALQFYKKSVAISVSKSTSLEQNVVKHIYPFRVLKVKIIVSIHKTCVCVFPFLIFNVMYRYFKMYSFNVHRDMCHPQCLACATFSAPLLRAHWNPFVQWKLGHLFPSIRIEECSKSNCTVLYNAHNG